jgi:hypothetical protein
MSTRRERWYWCTFTSKRHRVTATVQAWSAQQAAAQFEADVRRETDEPGALTVELGLGPGDETGDATRGLDDHLSEGPASL